jgi:hypothetical protein
VCVCVCSAVKSDTLGVDGGDTWQVYTYPPFSYFLPSILNSKIATLHSYIIFAHTQQRERESSCQHERHRGNHNKNACILCVCCWKKFQTFIFPKKERNLAERKSLVDSSFPPSTFSFDIEYSSYFFVLFFDPALKKAEFKSQKENNWITFDFEKTMARLFFYCVLTSSPSPREVPSLIIWKSFRNQNFH